MLGHIDAWFYAHVAGVRSVRPPVVAPRPVAGVDRAEASRDTGTGTLRVAWDARGTFRVALSVPPGPPALLRLPAASPRGVTESAAPLEAAAAAVRVLQPGAGGGGGLVLQVLAGDYVFDMPLP